MVNNSNSNSNNNKGAFNSPRRTSQRTPTNPSSRIRVSTPQAPARPVARRNVTPTRTAARRLFNNTEMRTFLTRMFNSTPSTPRTPAQRTPVKRSANSPKSSAFKKYKKNKNNNKK